MDDLFIYAAFRHGNVYITIPFLWDDDIRDVADVMRELGCSLRFSLEDAI